MTETLKKYFPALSGGQLNKFSQLTELYITWNEKINVISRKDIDQLFVHHILHSLSISKIIFFKDGTRIIDVGTGGGFPGIPLAIMFPDCEFLLVDSIGKKINVVNEISKALNLDNVVALKGRAEELDTDCDFIVSRAVASITDIYKWTKHLINGEQRNALKNGWLLLKGGDLKEEISVSERHVKEFDISKYFEEDFFLSKKVVYFKK